MAVDLAQRLERIALWLEGRSRHFLAEAKMQPKNNQDPYLVVARDNAERAAAIREAIEVVRKRSGR